MSNNNMSGNHRPLGSNAKARRGLGWGGKGSAFGYHIPSKLLANGRRTVPVTVARVPVRREEYVSASSVTSWVWDGDKAVQMRCLAHQGKRERDRRAAL